VFPIACGGATAERSGNSLTEFEDLDLKSKARIWPRLSYMCHMHTPVDPQDTSGGFPSACCSAEGYFAHKKQPSSLGPP
jgi:hypothetical protein